ncbi:bifunctional DNA-binding transcriptional regulator/O6-methylguanine-DNA methyltransferase Ada [Aquabacterium sp.]|uniref:bifunctional DNA-binding transcriptional regulator/O6-methylguanine-DNA methyltransferase Ada n=1 Tax=Aquabacterium sp. TaxID=1872578 RepID=UPI002489BFD6|nr:bifunctional DNA-binding transcriptional regulator/O6-methylguanine-DNA methyltransferase Ada [Aquabacterium sp.]MDI1259006.1 bifunctional DNA-binding transcriptional regulator/O6-methylguanine-DNA methyltransferase Ada [Aquabacterium sp.]
MEDEARWAAVLAKDKRLDGEFVFAVKTTGIYCRPSCPARPAKRQNVEFFDTTVKAASAGYRACKRCKPDGMSQEHARHELVLQACQAMAQSESGLSLDDLATEVGLSPHHFHRIFKAATGLTPKQYQQAVQAKRVSSALKDAPSVTEALYDAGFSSSGRFYEGAGANLGMSPSSFRQGGANEHIRHTIEPCSLGMMLVAATPRGVCAIEFGDTEQALLERLESRFPKATLQAGDGLFKQWVTQILSYLAHPAGSLDLPLDVQGTVFQRRVWQALQSIPCGQTVSYTELAQRLGQPTAVRAVASACANNQIAVAIPCHRVVRTGGALAGYRWGLARKAELLRREGGES